MKCLELILVLIAFVIFTANDAVAEECDGVEVNPGGFASKEDPKCFTEMDCMNTLKILEPLFEQSGELLATVDDDKISPGASEKINLLVSIFSTYELHQVESCQELKAAQESFSSIYKSLQKLEDHPHDLQLVFPTEFHDVAEKVDNARIDVTRKLLDAFVH